MKDREQDKIEKQVKCFHFLNAIFLSALIFNTTLYKIKIGNKGGEKGVHMAGVQKEGVQEWVCRIKVCSVHQ